MTPRADPGPLVLELGPHGSWLLTLASKKLLAPFTPSVETSISERRASTWSPLSSCSSPAAALRKIRRNCRERGTRCWEGGRGVESCRTPGLTCSQGPSLGSHPLGPLHLGCCWPGRTWQEGNFPAGGTVTLLSLCPHRPQDLPLCARTTPRSALQTALDIGFV